MSVGTNFQTVNNITVQPIVQTSFRAQSSPVKDYPPDTVEINGKKKGLSIGKKVGIGVLGITAIVIGFIAKKTKQITKVAEHINFQEAKSIEEAMKWGKDNLGITNYEKYDNLEVLNWINKGITDLQNRIPLKKRLFKGVSFESSDVAEFFGRCDKDTLVLNKSIIDNVNELLSKDIKDCIKDGILVDNINCLKLNIQHKNITLAKEIERLCNKYQTNHNNLSWNEKIKIHEYIRKLYLIKNNKTVLSARETEQILNQVNPHYIIYHEGGHALHRKVVGEKIFGEMGKMKEIEEWGCKNKSITEEFLNTKSIQETASKVSDYAKESPLEFVAEVFAQMIEGRKFPDDVMALYKKYNGPII